ncbi:MAG: DUF3090 family protein [bacterium]
MNTAKHNFGVVEIVKTESLGVPGKRIFRILIDGAPPSAATLWVEKEQVYGIAMAMKKMIENFRAGNSPAAREGEEEGEGEGIPFLDDPEILDGGSKEVLEFKVGRLGLAFGPGENHITLFFHDEREDAEAGFGEGEGEEGYEEEFEEEGPASAPKLQISLTHERCDAFVQESLEVCSSGRGTDALSRNALVASGKVDPNTNGHFHS